jgi:hypothetical protein
VSAVELPGIVALAFDCPLCDRLVIGDDLSLEFESVLVYDRPSVAMWPGGPLVEDPAEPAQARVVDRVLSTSACGHAFPVSDWFCHLNTYEHGLGELIVKPRPEEPEL